MAASGSDASGRAAAGSQLGSLSNPELASLPAAELVVHLYNHRRASDFADVALVLAARESRLAEAEAQIRRGSEKEARLLAEIRAWERRATEAEAALRLLRADVRGPDRTAAVAARVGEQEGVEAGEVVVGAHASRDCTPSAAEEAASVLAMLAEAGDIVVPRLSPLRTTAAALLAPTPQRGEGESECNKENEDSVNSGHGHANVSQGNVLPDTSLEIEDAPIARSDHGLGRSEPKNHMISTLGQEIRTSQEPNQNVENTHGINISVDMGKGQAEEEGYCVDAAMSVASEDSGADEQGLGLLTESQWWDMLNTTKAQVSAWESELNTTDGGMPQASTTVHEGKIVYEAHAQGRSEATEARLRDEIVVCESKLLEAQAVIQAASKTEERLRAEIMECKEKATKTEIGLWAEIQARGCAVTNLEAWKHCAEEAQKLIRAASMLVARLRVELAASKRMATEAEARHRAEIKACEDKAASAITHLQGEISKRDHMALEYKAFMEDKIIALDGYHTAIQTGIRAASDGQDFMIKYLQNEVQELYAMLDDMQGRHMDEQRVMSGGEHTDAPSSSGAQAGGGQH
ncbi:unnamed protein product [Urochloa decumbens]|uniref:Uncharacterized protein n=1 Tax=Urochloa decumbens TaxID=240449 RepID=A0ABC9FWJ2_9POAL